MCSDGTEGTGGFQRGQTLHWVVSTINQFNLSLSNTHTHAQTYLISASLYSLTCLTERTNFLPGQFIRAAVPTVIYTEHAVKSRRVQLSSREKASGGSILVPLLLVHGFLSSVASWVTDWRIAAVRNDYFCNYQLTYSGGNAFIYKKNK